MEVVFTERYVAEVWDGSIESAQKIAELIGDLTFITVSPSGDIKLESDSVYFAMTPGDVIYKDETSSFSVVDAELVNNGVVTLEGQDFTTTAPEVEHSSLEFEAGALYDKENTRLTGEPKVDWIVWRDGAVHNRGTLGDGMTAFVLNRPDIVTFGGAVNIKCKE